MAKPSRARFGERASIVPFLTLIAVLVLAILICVFGWTTPFRKANGEKIRLKGINEIRFGIDIRGGVEAVFAPKDYNDKVQAEQLDAAAKVLNFRLDKLQILDRELTTSPSAGRIIVRFPWRSDETEFKPDEALQELGEMAYLSFRKPDGTIVVDGTDVEDAAAVFRSDTKTPAVSLKFKEEGAKRFAEVTEEMAGLSQPLAIYLDESLISAPVVREKITGGSASIESPNMTREEAFDLASKINGGALPFALEAISSSSLSPKLGRNSLHLMTLAGVISFLIICVYMIVVYRLPGVVGCISLTAQIVGVLLAISLPQQTLTLQGIAGIILSIGMGVDANIIIASRIREEARNGLTLSAFLHNGFTKAFSSVMDSNVTVAIAAIVLMIFGSGTILSFAYSLLAGVILNGITGVWMTRKMIASLTKIEGLRKPYLYGARRTA
ncbi:MAG: protein translocase subunit SecD [Eubacteriales bacterium]|nr:protein translocase subunit SecD [Eubacteriales bacterium]